MEFMDRSSTIKEAVFAVGLIRPQAGLLSPGSFAGCTRPMSALALVVLGQLSRIHLVLLQLAAGLWARWLWRRRLLGLEVGVRHACAG